MATKQKKSKAPRQSHMYKGIREMISSNATSASTSPLPLSASANAVVGLAPLGAWGSKLASGPTLVRAQILYPYLRWLYTTSLNFKEYRILRATLVVVGNVASTATGNFNVTSSKDYNDIVVSATAPSYSTGPAGTSVASLATKDFRVQLNIDTSWKVVAGDLVAIGSDQVTATPLHNIGDISFCSFALSNNSTVALGVMYLDYDVEFRGPINPSLNS